LNAIEAAGATLIPDPMASRPHVLLTPRDLEIFAALERTPLTAVQLLKLSAVFAQPFTFEKKVRARMLVLAAAGRVRRWRYAVAGCGAPNYYTLSRLGYRLVNDALTPAPAKRSFAEVGIAHQQHTYALAEFVVHLLVASHRAGVRVTGFCRENTVRLTVGQESVYPDCAFQLVTPDGQEFGYLVELDNRTERVRSKKEADSWERKIRIYEAYQDRCGKRFRVLVVTTRSSQRLTHILDATGELARNPDRSLFYGISLPEFLDCPSAATAPCFVDNRGRRAALIPKVRRSHPPRLASRPRGWRLPKTRATVSGLPEAVACPV